MYDRDQGNMPARRPQRRSGGRRGLLLLVAAVWLAAGLALLGLGGYTLLEGGSGAPAQTAFIRPPYEPPEPGPGDELLPAAPLGDDPYRLVIPKIDVDAPVAPFGLDEEGIPEIPYEGGLVAWYNFSSPPGTASNAVFAGHYTWYGDAVFRHLGELAPGDEVFLRGEDGTELRYRVSEVALVEPNLEEAQRWMGASDRDVVTLITCGGTFSWTGDPVFGGEYDKRQIVRADLVEVRPGGGAAAAQR